MWDVGEKEPVPCTEPKKNGGGEAEKGQWGAYGKEKREGEGKMRDEEKEKAFAWAKALCYYAGEDEAFLEQFFGMLTASEGVSGEFLYYLEHQDFLCAYKVSGYSLIDIMVWQMDHFKAQLDRDRADMKNNGDKMLLRAFHTMLLMEREPERYVNLMRTETGTDYPGKYN